MSGAHQQQQQNDTFKTQIAMGSGGGHGGESAGEVYAALNNIANGLESGVFPKLEAAGLLQGLESLTIFGPVNAGGLSFLVDSLKKGIELDSSMHHGGGDGAGGEVPGHGEGHHGDPHHDHHDKQSHNAHNENNPAHHGQGGEGPHHNGGAHSANGQGGESHHGAPGGGAQQQNNQPEQQYIGGVDPRNSFGQQASQGQQTDGSTRDSPAALALTMGGAFGGTGPGGEPGQDGVARGQEAEYMKNLAAQIKSFTEKLNKTGKFESDGRYTPNSSPERAQVFGNTAGALEGTELEQADPAQAKSPDQSPSVQGPKQQGKGGQRGA